MLVKFHRILFLIPMLLLSGCDYAVVCLNGGCSSKKKADIYPLYLPNAIINQPYSSTIHIRGSLISLNGLLKITPSISNLQIKSISSNPSDGNDILLYIIPQYIGEYQIHLSGVGNGSPLTEKIEHTYILNVLNQVSCNYQSIPYTSKKDQKNKEYFQGFLKLVELPKATFNQPYSHQIKLTAPTENNEYLSKNDVQIITYPQDSGLQIRPIHSGSYITVELYGKPKTIGNIEIVLKRYSILYKRYILPVVPNQLHCQ